MIISGRNQGKLDNLAKSIQSTKNAICRMSGPGSVKGVIWLRSEGTYTIARCSISGLEPGLHGLHVHEHGDIQDGCASTCSHYNPLSKPHGGRSDKDPDLNQSQNCLKQPQNCFKTVPKLSKIAKLCQNEKTHRHTHVRCVTYTKRARALRAPSLCLEKIRCASSFFYTCMHLYDTHYF